MQCFKDVNSFSQRRSKCNPRTQRRLWCAWEQLWPDTHGAPAPPGGTEPGALARTESYEPEPNQMTQTQPRKLTDNWPTMELILRGRGWIFQ